MTAMGWWSRREMESVPDVAAGLWHIRGSTRGTTRPCLRSVGAGRVDEVWGLPRRPKSYDRTQRIDVLGRFRERHRDAACAEYPDRANDWFPDGASRARRRNASARRAWCRPSAWRSRSTGAHGGPGVWGGASGSHRALLAAGVTGDLVRRWGVMAMQGREFDRDRQYERERRADIAGELGIAG